MAYTHNNGRSKWARNLFVRWLFYVCDVLRNVNKFQYLRLVTARASTIRHRRPLLTLLAILLNIHHITAVRCSATFFCNFMASVPRLDDALCTHTCRALFRS